MITCRISAGIQTYKKYENFDLYLICIIVSKCYNCTYVQILFEIPYIQSIAPYEGLLFLMPLVIQKWVIGTKMGTAVHQCPGTISLSYCSLLPFWLFSIRYTKKMIWDVNFQLMGQPITCLFFIVGVLSNPHFPIILKQFLVVGSQIKIRVHALSSTSSQPATGQVCSALIYSLLSCFFIPAPSYTSVWNNI